MPFSLKFYNAQHIFYNHLLQKHTSTPQIKVSNEEVWPSFFLFLCLCLLVLIRVNAFQRVVRIVQSTFSNQVLQQLEREEINPFKFHALALNLFFVLNVSFLIYKINNLYHFVLTDSGHFLQFSFFLLLILLVIVLKNILNKILVFFTDQRKVISDYAISSTLVNQTFGLFLFPFVILLEFSPFNPLVFISGAVVVLGGAVVLKWYRGLISGLIAERVGILQIFSYFCGLEILPFFVLVKYIIETF